MEPNQPSAAPPTEPFLTSLLKRVVRIIVTWNTILVCLIGTIFVFGALAAGSMIASDEDFGQSYEYIYGDGANQFLSIPVSGTILGSNNATDSFSSFFDSGYAYGYDIKQQLYDAAADDTIEGVILEIDSPGGTIYGAKAIADGVKHYREQTKKPVYAHVEGLGASGAYWAAVSTDKLFADYGSSVGSIGVIMGPFEYYDTVIATDGGLLGGGVITQNGVESTYITAGRSKDVGNPYRRLTAAELASLQKTVNNEYDSFVQYVSAQRKIPDATIRNDIGALVYDPKSAKELKLVDEVGSRQDAYNALAKATGFEDDFTVVRSYSEPGFVDALMGAVTGRNKQPKAEVDRCKLTQVSLAYHGDVSGWCTQAQ